MLNLRLMKLHASSAHTRLFIGLMSGTSLDGVDAVLIEQSDDHVAQIAQHFLAYSDEIKALLLSLHMPAHHELHTAAIVSNQLAELYANAVKALLTNAKLTPDMVTAIGCHGQTIRHCPDLPNGQAYTIQLGNHARLAELTQITVVGDFRSRDIAAGGQGAPLVPAFHHAVFAAPDKHRVIINIGGIANLSDLPIHGKVTGFDSGPGNLLMDAWTLTHTGNPYDASGAWAVRGEINKVLLQSFLSDPYFSQPIPKSTGRDLFNQAWLNQHLQQYSDTPQNVARTLLELTATTIAEAMRQYCSGAEEVYVCGGGAHNLALTDRLQTLCGLSIQRTDTLGVGVDWVEAVAFAWLAQRCIDHQPSNLPAVTGASGLRILGAIYPC